MYAIIVLIRLTVQKMYAQRKWQISYANSLNNDAFSGAQLDAFCTYYYASCRTSQSSTQHILKMAEKGIQLQKHTI